MKGERPGHVTKRPALFIGYAHCNAPVELALGRAVAVNGAAQEFTIRAEEAAGMGVGIGKRMIPEDLTFVLINFGCECCAG